MQINGVMPINGGMSKETCLYEKSHDKTVVCEKRHVHMGKKNKQPINGGLSA